MPWRRGGEGRGRAEGRAAGVSVAATLGSSGLPTSCGDHRGSSLSWPRQPELCPTPARRAGPWALEGRGPERCRPSAGSCRVGGLRRGLFEGPTPPGTPCAPRPSPPKIKWGESSSRPLQGSLSACVSGDGAGPQRCWPAAAASGAPAWLCPPTSRTKQTPGRRLPAARGSGILRPLRPQR